MIQDESYTIHESDRVAVGTDVAVCRYGFNRTGRIEGQYRSGSGRGTNVLTQRGGVWKILHEHLSW